MPLVSVLLPVFNGERYLRTALDSVLAQTFHNFELLVLDDGSTDRTLEIVRSYARLDPRLRVLTRENRGLVATLNEMLSLARGEFVARMDADDICLPDRFERQVAWLRAHPGVVCVGGDHELIDERGRRLTTVRTLPHDAEIQQQALRGHGSICHPSAMIRTEALRRIGGYRPEFYPAEDLDLWLRLGEIGELANLCGAVLRYRLHTQSISESAASGRQRAAGLRCCEAAWRRRGLHDMQFDATEPWRPGSERASRLRFLLRYGWWAFNSRERGTCLAYGLKAVRTLPTSRDAWMLLAAGLAKPMPRPAPRDREHA